MDKFIYLRNSASSTGTDIDTLQAKAWTALDRLSVIWSQTWRSFFKAIVVSILLYRCTTWTLTKRMEKKLDGNYTRMLQVILNNSWRQHPTKQHHLPLTSKIIQARRTRHAERYWRSRDELISDILLWTPSHGRAKAERPTRTYIQQPSTDIWYSHEDLSGVMDDRDG